MAAVRGQRPPMARLDVQVLRPGWVVLRMAILFAEDAASTLTVARDAATRWKTAPMVTDDQ